MDMCSVKDCKELRHYGDLLFCSGHRKKWRDFCKLNEMESINYLNENIQSLLKEFQDGQDVIA